MTEVYFSICIPTYNRCKYLKENIDEILRQVADSELQNIEICISDNSSSDNTKELLESYSNISIQNVNIRYQINDTNLGYDINCSKVMNMAKGMYSWLLGSDDIIERHALQKIISLTLQKPDIGIFLFNRINCDIEMNRLPTTKQVKMLRNDIETQTFDFSEKFQEIYYYSLCRSVGGIFAYISSVVYKTEAVTSRVFDESFVGSAYAHIFYWLNYLKTGKKLMYITDPLILCRIGLGLEFCDSILSRHLLDLNGFKFIKNKIFVNDIAGFDFINVLSYEHSFSSLLAIYSHISITEWKDRLKPMLISVGWRTSDIEFIETIGNTPNLYQSRFKQKIKRIFPFNLFLKKTI